MNASLPQRLCSEALGCALLAATVVGSGIMGETLAGGNVAVALLANTFATIATLFVIIKLLAPVSGAHFNPAVSLVVAFRGMIGWRDALSYSLVQIAGCCLGAWIAHLMFDLPLLQSSQHIRSGGPQLLSEAVATFGLLLVVLYNRNPGESAGLVASWIGAAYWFTASTSFANPAITVARSLTDTFAGIRPVDVPEFMLAQFAGAFAALLIARLFSNSPKATREALQVDIVATNEKTRIRDDDLTRTL